MKGAILVYYGIFVTIFSSGIQSLGLVLQRKATCTGGQDGRSVYRSGVWQGGIGLFVGASVLGGTVQIATLPLMVVAPLQSCGLLFNSFFAWVLLGESLGGRLAVVGAVLVCLGGVVLGTLGTQMSCGVAGERHDYEKLVEYGGRGAFLWYFVGSTLVAVWLVCAVYALPQPPRRVGGCGSGQRSGMMLGLASGILSGHSLLCAKCVADIVLERAPGVRVGVVVRQALPVAGLFVVFAVSQLHLLGQTMYHVTMSILYPLVYSVFNTVTILNGAMFYEHEQGISVQYVVVVVLGLLTLGTGMALLSRSSSEGARGGERLGGSDLSGKDCTDMLSGDSIFCYGSMSWEREVSDEDEYVSLPRRHVSGR
ncbi:uncharacterized protein Ecym_5231 [Eremothecium cymbalariae DBVPG|uniref:Magnesium transporter n=1 Tax=Eremothecium cymbalariae (strain CBS 270.75 / DBVPG 7215 / KCTC 17166 / NRRL Y-17582) TaxID=931890 RepID=I6ND57_ERECY|nr:hypothetical protein Ecym_5231 [Eremothecium cymbalariae DBVPG\